MKKERDCWFRNGIGTGCDPVIEHPLRKIEIEMCINNIFYIIRYLD